MSKIYTIIDLETTGLSPRENQIIEIAAVKTDLKRELATFHTYVKLGERFKTVPEEIIALTGITTKLTETGIEEDKAIELLNNFIDKDNEIVVAQHAPFDFSFIYSVDNRIEFPNFLCTRSLAKVIEPDESASLKHVYQRLFGEEVPNHHSALADVQATKRVLKKQLGRLGLVPLNFPAQRPENILIDSEERPLTFVPKHSRVFQKDEHGEFIKIEKEL